MSFSKGSKPYANWDQSRYNGQWLVGPFLYLLPELGPASCVIVLHLVLCSEGYGPGFPLTRREASGQ